MGRKTMATVRKALEEELDLLADQYHEEPESLPHGLIAEAGIQAILDSIRSKPQG